ncbi:MAG: SDR family NAD(P)-dependent oxidoreductase [Pseudomonadota bacterium]|nr:SDR family NAD(P)-dependent oxidoreductase [Pseudomonadota bacterium]
MRKFAIVTGASSGIGLEIARLAAKDGYDLLVAADEPLVDAAAGLKDLGVEVRSIEADLATEQGVKQLLQAVGDRPVDVLVANAGHGLGNGFLEQQPKEWMHVIQTNVTGTLLLIQPIIRAMVERGEGKVLITGSIAGHLAGSFHAVYNGSKAFIDSFAAALGEEIRDRGVTVTCLKPGATDTNFFKRAEMLDTKVGQSKKDEAADVAKTGWQGMLDGEPSVIHGLKNKAQVAAAGVMTDAATARLHRMQAEPGSGKN